MKLISFVIPCYRSAATLPGVVKEIEDTMKEIEGYDHEIIMINDCSPDDTFGVITSLCTNRHNMLGIDLARNFGQHSALMAGFHYAKGDIVICLDDDGQTPACEAGKLIQGIGRPYFLAGGLSAENVGDAVTLLHPFAVDVSSGIETDGVKDKIKMAAFVAAVRKEDRL